VYHSKQFLFVMLTSFGLGLLCTTAYCAGKKLTSADATVQANQVIQALKTQRYTDELGKSTRSFITQLDASGFHKLADNVRGVLSQKVPPPLPPRAIPEAITKLSNQTTELKEEIENLNKKMKQQEEYYLASGKLASEITKQFIEKKKNKEIAKLKQTIEELEKELKELKETTEEEAIIEQK